MSSVRTLGFKKNKYLIANDEIENKNIKKKTKKCIGEMDRPIFITEQLIYKIPLKKSRDLRLSRVSIWGYLEYRVVIRLSNKQKVQYSGNPPLKVED